MEKIKNILRNARNILLIGVPLLVPLTWQGLDSLCYKTLNYADYINRKGPTEIIAISKIDGHIEARGNHSNKEFYDTNKDGIYNKMTEHVLTGFRAGVPMKGKEYNINENPEKFQKIQEAYDSYIESKNNIQ